MIINPKLTNGKVLFNGYNTSDTITLNDNINNYSALEVITYLQSQLTTHKLYIADSNIINLTDVASGGAKWQQVRTLRGTFSGNTLTLDRAIGINVNMEAFTFQSYDADIKCIKKIIGYK